MFTNGKRQITAVLSAVLIFCASGCEWQPDVTVKVVKLAPAALLIAAAAVTAALLRRRRRRKKKELELRSRETLFDMLTRNTDDVFVLFSPEDYRAEYVSPNLDRVLGMDPELVRQDVRILLFPDTAQEERDAFARDLLDGIPLDGDWTGEMNIRHLKTFEPLWFKELLHHGALDEGDRFIFMLSDRTKERQMYETLKDALNTAKSANEAKSNFLANVSHDIRTPMNAVVGLSALLRRDAEQPDKVREYAGRIESTSRNILAIVDEALDLPIAAQPRDGRSDPGAARALSGMHILAAEDNEINGEILTELLGTEGIRCEVVQNGKLALERFLRSAPGEFDMILMDVQMPVMNGYEATRAIRDSGHPEARRIPIIAMTANAFEEDVQAALCAGMDAHTAKPLDMEKLKAQIARLRAKQTV